MSAGPLETYNGTTGVADTGGDSLTQDREFLFPFFLGLDLCNLHTVLSDLALYKIIIY